MSPNTKKTCYWNYLVIQAIEEAVSASLKAERRESGAV
jgi:hypothetical protein